MSHDDFPDATGDPLHILRAVDITGTELPIAPDPAFARALRDRLERGATLPKGAVMSTPTETPDLAPTPNTHADSRIEHPGALPYLTVGDGRAAIDWYVANLGARLRGAPIQMGDGRIGHAELELGGGVVYLADEFADLGLRAPQPGQVSVSLLLSVADTDAALAAARRSGAIVTREPDETHGNRTATVIDPFGHRWMLTGPTLAELAAQSGRATRPDGERIHPGDIAYMSLQTPDADRAARFYGAVLGWRYDPQLRQVTNLGHRLGISTASGYGVNTVYCVFAVADFAETRAGILAAGGRAGEVSLAGDGVRVLDAVDPQGVAFSVYVPAADEPRPAQHPRGLGELSYLTVHTPDSARLRDFYGRVLGWSFRPGRVDDGWEVDHARPQVGVAGGSTASVAVPMWNTDDAGAAVERVRAAGGRVLDAPQTAPYGITARCVDDQGAEFYLGQLF
ncbi:VOC family protein [Gordonia sp. ABSL1-1]|uniref:VOC family protein n=1 Tax=Gordonia sp. ABSL1-1 TaxID=3053923 RepID=UPI0025744F93|nr:VOC family protein [Gordonia sp. ABSL1-1]MDL9936840.1 VOC family protein [Gordonia sp. ABSL1-1]